MSQSFFKLDKSWYDGELWTIPGDYQNMCFCDSELLKIYDGGDFIIAAIRNYPFTCRHRIRFSLPAISVGSTEEALMDNPVYWYDALIIFGRDSQKVLFKSDHLYEYGDRIVKRYDSGAVVSLIIKYGYGSAFPAHELNRLKNASLWPPIISEI